MVTQRRTHVNSPSVSLVRKLVVLSFIHACASTIAFLLSLIGALFLGSYDSPLKAIIFTLIPLTEASAMIILLVFFRRDYVQRSMRPFAHAIVLVALINLFYIIYALSNLRWDNLVNAISFVLLALVAADCYHSCKRILISNIALILTGACQLISLIYHLMVMIIASPDEFKAGVVAFSCISSLFSTLPYLILLLYLHERIMINNRLTAVETRTS